MLAVSFFFCHLLDQHCLYEGLLLPPANEVCEGYVFTPVCQSFCSQWGVGWWVCPIACWDTPPWDQRQVPSLGPEASKPQPGTRGRPPWDQTPPAQCMPGDTCNKRAVCILLEFDLVIYLFLSTFHG